MSYYFMRVAFVGKEGNTREYSKVFEVTLNFTPVEVWNFTLNNLKDDMGDRYFVIKDFKKL